MELTPQDVEKILWEEFQKCSKEWQEYKEQMALAMRADMDLMMHGRSAVVMEGEKIVRVIDPRSQEFPK